MPTNFFFILIPFNIVLVHFIRIGIQIGNGINEVKSNEGVTGGDKEAMSHSLTTNPWKERTNERKETKWWMKECATEIYLDWLRIDLLSEFKSERVSEWVREREVNLN